MDALLAYPLAHLETLHIHANKDIGFAAMRSLGFEESERPWIMIRSLLTAHPRLSFVSSFVSWDVVAPFIVGDRPPPCILRAIRLARSDSSWGSSRSYWSAFSQSLRVFDKVSYARQLAEEFERVYGDLFDPTLFSDAQFFSSSLVASLIDEIFFQCEFTEHYYDWTCETDISTLYAILQRIVSRVKWGYYLPLPPYYHSLIRASFGLIFAVSSASSFAGGPPPPLEQLQELCLTILNNAKRPLNQFLAAFSQLSAEESLIDLCDMLSAPRWSAFAAVDINERIIPAVYRAKISNGVVSANEIDQWDFEPIKFSGWNHILELFYSSDVVLSILKLDSFDSKFTRRVEKSFALAAPARQTTMTQHFKSLSANYLHANSLHAPVEFVTEPLIPVLLSRSEAQVGRTLHSIFVEAFTGSEEDQASAIHRAHEMYYDH